MTFEATATVQTETVQSPQQIITTDVVYYYHNDHLGTPLYMSDESGKEVWRRELEPFGSDTFLRGTVIENLRLPGQYYDVETGNNQNWNRDYNSKLGRYIEPDPIGQSGGINPIIYVDNSPLMYKDRTGLDYYDDLQKQVDQLAEQLSKGNGMLKQCRCEMKFHNDKNDCARDHAGEATDYEIYKCLVNALANFRKCLGSLRTVEDKLTPPPGYQIPNPGPGRGKKVPNNPDRNSRWGGR